MTTILYYEPGQQATLIVDIYNSANELVDGYSNSDGYIVVPVVDNIYLPNNTTASGYPQNMTKLVAGVYYHKFTLPSGTSAVGSYIAHISLNNDDVSVFKNTVIQVVASIPSLVGIGNFSISPG